MEHQEYYSYKCPHCRVETNAATVVAALPDEVLIAETARRHGRRQTPHAGPGRPSGGRCPGCDIEMSSADLREHRLGCVGQRLKELKRRRYKIRLLPKDPDPYPDFDIERVTNAEVDFQKLSSSQHLSVELQKIAEITIDSAERMVSIRLLGRVRWNENTKQWHFVPTIVGRPRRRTRRLHS